MQRLLTSLAFALALVAFAGTAQAQSRLELARQYVQLPGVQKMMVEMFSPETMYEQMKASIPPNAKISNSKKRRMGNVMSQAMMQLLPAFNKIMIKDAARVFTKAELKAMLAFYSTPEGSAILSKSVTFSNRALRQLAPQMQQMQQAVAPAIIKILKD